MTAFDDGLWARLVDEHDAERVALGPAPQHSSRRRLAVRVSGIAAVCAGGVLAAVLSLVGAASTAFAGWTPQPTKATAAQLATTEAYCERNVPWPGLPLKLVDARGPFTWMVYSDGSSNAFCTTGPSFRNGSGWQTSSRFTVPAGRLFLWTDHVSADSGQPYGSMIAQAGAGVTAARITLDNGAQVAATVENGWAVAWWPGAYHVASARLTTPSGTHTQTFPPYPCDVHSCDGGGPHGGAPGGGPGGG